MHSEKAVTVLLPTFHRPRQLERALRSVRDTTKDVKIVVACDPDDEKAPEIAQRYGAAVTVCEAPRLGCAHASNTALRAAPDDDIYVIFADDAVFTKGWYQAAMRALDKLGGSGLVAFKSGRRKKFSDHYMMTRDFIIQHHGGVAAVPHYSAWCLDDEAQYRAERAKKWIRADDAIVTHMQGEQHDAGYMKNEQAIERNRAIFYQRKAENWPDDFEPIIRDENGQSIT